MATDFSKIKQKLDLPCWQATSQVQNAAAAVQTINVAGSTLVSDKRPSQYAQSLLWLLTSTTQLFQYRTKGNGWTPLLSPALSPSFGAGATGIFAPSQGPRGVLAAGASTTKVILSTALPAAVGINSLVGQRIRIVGNSAGLGKTEERTITSNTAGTTPTITLDTALSFTPAVNNIYEILAGRVFLLGAGAAGAGIWKYYDIATNSMSGNLSTTNLPATIGTASPIVSLDELHTPITGVGGAAINGETGGYFGTLTATAATGTTLTGQSTGGDVAVLANEYRNFQIRIVEDTTNPTAVGQRRKITSHTAGPSPVYTVSAWTVTPSATAKYMIENNNDILLWTGTNLTTYAYDPVANTWSSSAYAAAPAANAGGSIAFHPFGLELNAEKTQRHSFIYKFRGGNTATLDIFDISAASTGSWTTNAVYDNQGAVTVTVGASHIYNALDNVAMIAPYQLASTQVQMYYFDVEKNSLRSYTPCQAPASGTIAEGDRMGIDFYTDGTDKKAIVYFIPSGQTYGMSTLFINGD
jgi:hypothetical protein